MENQEVTRARLRIFISYGHDENKELVYTIKADLECRGHDIWIDDTKIKGGDDWRREITEGIINSQGVVSFMSKHSTRDPGTCLDEIAIAIGVKGGNIQTILVESEQEVQPPASISHIQWLDMHDWKEKKAAGGAIWEAWYQAKLAEIVRVIESPQSIRFAGEIEELNKCLKPISPEARLREFYNKKFVGREWLANELERWRTGDQYGSRIFWLVGGPGVGKSAFSAWLSHHEKHKIVAVQFCEWDKPDHRDAKRVVSTLAFQLATRLPDYRKLLLTLPEIKTLDDKNAAERFEYLLANPLQHSIGGKRERYLILVDAIDEAFEGERNPLVELLAKHASRLPEWIAFVVTSRPEASVKTPLQGLKPFVLDAECDANLADLRKYLKHGLALELDGREDGQVIITTILSKSEGNFLYAEKVLDDVRQGFLSINHLEQFPQGLGGIYAQFFTRQFPDAKDFKETVRPALAIILAATDPITVGLIGAILGWNKETMADFTRKVGSLFTTSIEKDIERTLIKPFHKSVVDWLVDSSKAGIYFTDKELGHQRLVGYGYEEYMRDPSTLDEYFYFRLTKLLQNVKRDEDAARIVDDERFLSGMMYSGAITTPDIKKVIIAGLGGSGKDVFDRFNTNAFITDHRKIIGAAFCVKDVTFENGVVIKIQIWDFAEDKRFRFLIGDYSRGAGGALICFDVTDYETLKNLPELVTLIRKEAPSIPMLLVGTKDDLPHHQVSYEVARQFSMDTGCVGVTFCSIKNPASVKQAFSSLVKWMIHQEAWTKQIVHGLYWIKKPMTPLFKTE